jgi:prevent-host-death family protein
MNKNNTITIQELRLDPVGFLRQVNRGKTITVIYRSKPLAVVASAEEKTSSTSKNIQRMLEYAELTRKSAKKPLDPGMSYKEAYRQDMAKKYDIS